MNQPGMMTADRIGGLIWVVLGAAIIYGSWSMDRLTSLQIHPATAPGLVPGLLGAGIVILGLVLLLRRKASATGDFAIAQEAQERIPIEPQDAADESIAWNRVLLSWALCITYGAVLLGHGLPYWILTAAFLFVHINLIDDTDNVPARLDRKRALIAATIAVLFAIAVALVFEKIFLVRLP